VGGQSGGRSQVLAPLFPNADPRPNAKEDVAHHSTARGAASASSGLPGGPRALHVGLSSASVQNVLKRGDARPAHPAHQEHASSAPDHSLSESSQRCPVASLRPAQILLSLIASGHQTAETTLHNPDWPLPPTAARPSARFGIMGTLAAWPVDLAAASRSGRSSRPSPLPTPWTWEKNPTPTTTAPPPRRIMVRLSMGRDPSVVSWPLLWDPAFCFFAGPTGTGMRHLSLLRPSF
jgi:hypothetical protein